MTYKIKVTPKYEREQQIGLGCQNPIERSAFHEYQNSTVALPVIRMALDLPIYRIANGRTRTEQLKYLRQRTLQPNFFVTGQENVEVQQAQHEILDRFARQGTPSIAPIADILREGKQTDPILITNSGVVINGNRRLAAMRELYVGGLAAHQSFSHINCKVLPAATTDKEIKEIELRLQMQPETKLPYSWVNEALTIKDLMQTGFTRDEIARDMRKKPAEIDGILQALAHAEIYLKDWRKEPEDYDRVEGATQLFSDMAKLLKDKTGEELEVSRRVAFMILDNSNQLGSRVYSFNFSFGKRSSDVAEALANRLGIDLVAPTIGDSSSEDALDIDFQEEDEGISFQPLIDALDDPARREEMSEELIDVIESIKAAAQDERRGQATLKAIRDANTKLYEADLSSADMETYTAIMAQLESVIKRAAVLKQQLIELGVTSPTPAS